MRNIIFAVLFLFLAACELPGKTCNDPHGVRCILDIYHEVLPKGYAGSLSVLAVEQDGLGNDASRFVSVLNDCQKTSCWFAIDASKGKYFSDVMYEAKRLEKILLLGKIDKVTAVLIVREEDKALYEKTAFDIGVNAHLAIHPNFRVKS